MSNQATSATRRRWFGIAVTIAAVLILAVIATAIIGDNTEETAATDNDNTEETWFSNLLANVREMAEEEPAANLDEVDAIEPADCELDSPTECMLALVNEDGEDATDFLPGADASDDDLEVALGAMLQGENIAFDRGYSVGFETEGGQQCDHGCVLFEGLEGYTDDEVFTTLVSKGVVSPIVADFAAQRIYEQLGLEYDIDGEVGDAEKFARDLLVVFDHFVGSERDYFIIPAGTTVYNTVIENGELVQFADVLTRDRDALAVRKDHVVEINGETTVIRVEILFLQSCGNGASLTKIPGIPEVPPPGTPDGPPPGREWGKDASLSSLNDGDNDPGDPSELSEPALTLEDVDPNNPDFNWDGVTGGRHPEAEDVNGDYTGAPLTPTPGGHETPTEDGSSVPPGQTTNPDGSVVHTPHHPNDRPAAEEDENSAADDPVQTEPTDDDTVDDAFCELLSSCGDEAVADESSGQSVAPDDPRPEPVQEVQPDPQPAPEPVEPTPAPQVSAQADASIEQNTGDSTELLEEPMTLEEVMSETG